MDIGGRRLGNIPGVVPEGDSRFPSTGIFVWGSDFHGALRVENRKTWTQRRRRDVIGYPVFRLVEQCSEILVFLRRRTGLRLGVPAGSRLECEDGLRSGRACGTVIIAFDWNRLQQHRQISLRLPLGGCLECCFSSSVQRLTVFMCRRISSGRQPTLLQGEWMSWAWPGCIPALVDV